MKRSPCLNTSANAQDDIPTGGEELEIKRACAELRMIVKLLDKSKTRTVIRHLPENTEKTLKELVEDTGIPQTTLYEILNALWENGLIYRTVERPVKYGRTEFLGYVLSIGERICGRTHKIPLTDTILYEKKIETP